LTRLHADASLAGVPKLLVEQRGPVTVLTLNRPEVHNCVDAETAVLLAESIERFAADPAARVLVLTGSGGTAFCSGADLKDVDRLLRHPYAERASPMGFARLDPGKPTVAAVNGYCFAGGMELACWCDFRIAEEHAEFGALNRRWGVPFFDGGTQRFPRILGQGHALWLVETGVRFGARHALTIGLVQEVVPTGRALARALELAEAMARYPQASLRTDRQAVLATFGMSLAEGLRYEAEVGLRSAQDPEMKAGLDRFARRDRPAPPGMPAA
ncbi:MAG TPA: enoyl-CoA hydratase-related protein, partial [Calidithermus sp.]|nr:enoyl-CoA hydratase-related protein [Calidithermus sp.]